MATRQYFRNTRTASLILDSALTSIKTYRDMNGTIGPGQQNSSIYSSATSPPQGAPELQYERIVWISTSGQIGFFSERFASETTLSGDVVFSLWGNTNLPTTTGTARYRVRLYKVTTGGSYVEQYIGQGDGTDDITSAIISHPLTVTITTPVTIAPNERVLVKLWTFLSSGVWGTASNTTVFRFDGVAGTSDSYMDLPGTITLKPNLQQLSLRRTTGTAIGNFMDLLSAFGTGAKTSAVVNTVASGTEVPWTKTAGGIVAEWISPRFKAQWSYPTMAVNVYALESATAANISLRVKTFRRRPDGTEDFLAQDDWNSAAELTTTEALLTLGVQNFGSVWDINNNTTVHFAEDDRLVVRFYAIPAATLTMAGARTGTISYDGPSATAGSSYLETHSAPDFKAETDPPAQPIPSGTSMMGFGNGQ